MTHTTGAGTLHIVATPLGNLGDMVPRAIEVLQSVAVVAAEDTRHSAPLLKHFGIHTPLVACDDHQERERSGQLVRRLLAGEDIALISDAGTPLISDPGYRLVQEAHAAGIRVSPVPGPCAVIAALCCAGLPTDRFCFEGFLPARTAARREALNGLKAEPRTLVFYEAPHRLLESLEDMASVFGDTRLATLGRELTKTFETIRSLPLGELRDWVREDTNQQRGESVLVVAGCPAPVDGEALTPEVRQVLEVLMQELPLKQAAQLASRLTGVKKNLLYDAGLAMKQGG